MFSNNTFAGSSYGACVKRCIVDQIECIRWNIVIGDSNNSECGQQYLGCIAGCQFYGSSSIQEHQDSLFQQLEQLGGE